MSRRLGNPLPRSFYLRPTITVAKDLLGKYLVRRLQDRLLIGKIVEVEAYLGEKDPASHAYRGKTKRNEVMFMEGGHLYVYFTYGMHFCCNVVTEEEGKGRAVLLRAVEPLEGIEVMRKNRSFDADRKDHWNLTNGPAKLCEAFGIRREENGADLTKIELFLTEGNPVPRTVVGSSERIGIKNGKDKKWRFYVKGNLFVSV
ncbi:MAG: DNA-3-methyladenine glycosylase [Bacteroidota bacterium]